MRQDREHPLYHLDAETLLVATYIWVDDELKALQAQGLKLPPKQKHQKATLAELLTLAVFFLLQGQDLAKGYLAAKTTLKAYFPSLPHLSRFYRVLQKSSLGPLPQMNPSPPSPPGHKALWGTRPSARGEPQTHPPGPRPQGPRPRPPWVRSGGRSPGSFRGLRPDGGHERPRPLFSLGPSPRERPGDLGS